MTMISALFNGATAAKAQAVKLTVKGRAYTLSVEPYEIFTAVIDGERIAKVDMLEENPI